MPSVAPLRPACAGTGGRLPAGLGGRDHRNTHFLEEAEIPLPSLVEQKRIVAKVEELLARVNAARERLARVPAILKRFRQSVLAAACSGRLTEDWREQRGLSKAVRDTHGLPYRSLSVNPSAEQEAHELPNGWSWEKAGSAYVEAGYGTSVRCERAIEDGVPVLRVPNIASGRIECRDLKYAPRQAVDKRSLTLKLGDILLPRQVNR